MLPSIGIPTTAGTGSEAQSFALISQAETHVKMACGDRKARFRTVILDPELIASAPPAVKAAAGFDAIAHAVESYVCTKANAVSRMYAREAFRLLDASLLPFVEGKPGAEAGDVLLGAHFAGMAIEASMLGAAHGCANPLTAKYGMTHGVAVALMLPSVVGFNARGDRHLYDGLSRHDDLESRLLVLRSSLHLPERLSDLEVNVSEIQKLAEAAAQEWTATFNPRPIDAEVARGLYEAVY
jgi:alcohol dehydrogenase